MERAARVRGAVTIPIGVPQPSGCGTGHRASGGIGSAGGAVGLDGLCLFQPRWFRHSVLSAGGALSLACVCKHL